MAAQQNFEGPSPLRPFLPDLVSAELGRRGGRSAPTTGTLCLLGKGAPSLPPPSSSSGSQRRSSQSRLLLLVSFLDQSS